jgi:hypothetical protein
MDSLPSKQAMESDAAEKGTNLPRFKPSKKYIRRVNAKAQNNNKVYLTTKAPFLLFLSMYESF